MGFTEDDAVLALNQPAITGAEAAINWLFDTSDEEKARLRAVQLADVIAQTEGEAEASRQNATNELDDKSSLEEIGQAADIMGGSTAEGADNIGSGNGNMGNRSGMMIHSDIDPYGTLGCIGVDLGGKPESRCQVCCFEGPCSHFESWR